MSDTRQAEQPEGGKGGAEFDTEWDRLDRAETTGQADPEDAPLKEEARSEAPAGKEEAEDQRQPAAEEEREREDPDATAEAEKPAGSETADDIWANATPEQREALTALEARASSAENTVRSNNGRWSAAQRELDALRARIADQPAPAGDAAAGGKDPKVEAAERAEKHKLLREEYSDFAPALIDELEELRSRMETLSADRTKQAEAEVARAELARKEAMAREETTLLAAHPDFDPIVKSEAFANWALSQPRMVHDALIRNADGIVDAAEAAKILADYKRETQSDGADPLAERRERQMEGGRHVPSRTGTQPGGKGKATTFDDEWDRLDAEDAARERGRDPR